MWQVASSIRRGSRRLGRGCHTPAGAVKLARRRRRFPVHGVVRARVRHGGRWPGAVEPPRGQKWICTGRIRSGQER